MGEPVEIVDCDPAWPEAARAEAARIGSALAALAMEHVGSTAVPGLAAKPILDLLVGVADLDYVEGRVPAMESLGYEYRGSHGIQQRRYFVKRRPRTHHVHVTQAGLHRGDPRSSAAAIAAWQGEQLETQPSGST